MPKYWVLIPAYKPDSRLVDLIEKLWGDFELLVIDDGGGETFAGIFQSAKESGATVLHHEFNRGKGAAIKTGLSWLRSMTDIEGVITADCDGQHTSADIRKVSAAMEEHPNTVIIGGRDFSNMPARSRFGNTITRFFFRMGTGSRISDTQSGLRGLPFSYFDKMIATKGDRYEYEMNVLLNLGEWGAPALEIPIDTIYINDNSSSHFNSVKDGLKVFSRVLRYFFSSIISAVVDYSLYLLFLSWLSASWSFVAARALSSILNYVLNATMVFRSTPTVKNAVSYFGLVIAVMVAGSLGIEGLSAFGVGNVVSKIIMDCILYILNYVVQKKVIFKK